MYRFSECADPPSTESAIHHAPKYSFCQLTQRSSHVFAMACGIAFAHRGHIGDTHSTYNTHKPQKERCVQARTETMRARPGSEFTKERTQTRASAILTGIVGLHTYRSRCRLFRTTTHDLVRILIVRIPAREARVYHTVPTPQRSRRLEGERVL